MLRPYTTSVVGSYSVPPWYEVLEKQVEAGALSPADMQDVQFRASQAAIADQEFAGIDVITGGEMHRRTNNRNAPPNAMLNYFWQRIPGFSSETRPKNITPKDEHVTHPAQVLTGPVKDADLTLADEYKMVAKFTHPPAEVKVTMTGPHMLAKVAWDEYYNDINTFMHELAKVLNANFRKLQDAGCKHVQVDEPLFAAVDRTEVQQAVDAINQAFEGVTMTKWVHICQGNYAYAADYDGQIGHRYFDFGHYPADLIVGIDCDAIMAEYDFVDQYQGLLKNQQMAAGVADVINPMVESPETLIERAKSYSWLPREQTLLTTSCGLNHHSREIALGKLQSLQAAANKLK
ncbi:MAG TPA: hypothetical protein VE152_06765 [Acidimicrobiales bacterium]|nr:hypothetical protein [Acidimicrobiales bacterium]